MEPKTYRLGRFVSGDTIRSRTISATRTVGGVVSDEDLTNVTVNIGFTGRKTGAKMTITNGKGLSTSGNVLTWDAFTCPPKPDTYTYQIEFNYPDGRKRTYMRGTLVSYQDGAG